MPVAAVSAAGSAIVSSGSSTTSAALIALPQSQVLAPSARVKIAVRVVSEPVPEVVGTQIAGRRFSGKSRLPNS